MSFDPSLLPDVADALGIERPAIVEKDFYAVQLLKLLAALKPKDFDLVFAGGTSLAKAHQNTYRMSEDIDIKLVPRLADTDGMSRSALKGARKAVLKMIEDCLEESEYFTIEPGGIKKRNEYQYAEFLITYPQTQAAVPALRPHLKLDVTQSNLIQPPVSTPLQSLYSEALNQAAEVVSFPSVDIQSTASEKLVALLRRTAHVDRDSSRKDDKTLVRHVYDLHLIVKSGCNLKPIGPLLQQVMRTDAEQFGRQHDQFLANPKAEMLHGLTCLQTNPVHKERYETFIGPLVYHESPAQWDETMKTLTDLTNQLL
jgi:predicted nucleotidyltransferase component of viral defense system